MMREALRGLWHRPWITLAGVVLGILLAPAISYSVGMLADFYYTIAPISKLSGELLRADARDVYVHLRAEKRYAPACQFVVLRARTLDINNEYERANIERIDMPMTGDPLPPGKHDIGIWRVEPRSDGVAVTITPMYDCAGRVVLGTGVVLRLPALLPEPTVAPLPPAAKRAPVERRWS